jgi:hypothetical protein
MKGRTEKSLNSFTAIMHKVKLIFRSERMLWKLISTFCFLILFQGYKRTLQFDDVFDIPDALYTRNVYPEFESQFQALTANAGKTGKQVGDFLQGDVCLLCTLALLY